MKTYLSTELLHIVVNDKTLFLIFDAAEMSQKVALTAMK